MATRASTALTTLTASFERAFDRVGRDPQDDRLTVVLSWPAAPVELIRAARLTPVMVRGTSDATPVADAHLEPDVFPARLRHLADAALTGRLAHVACVLIPRTSDPDYKGFLYLREFQRTGLMPARTPIRLFDLLQSHGDEVRRHDAAATSVLRAALGELSRHTPTDDDIRREVAGTNEARAAARRLASLRRGEPRVTGSEVFPLLAAFWHVAPREYVRLADQAAADIAERATLPGPRILLAGAPTDTPTLHAAVESHGAVVVSELSPWSLGPAGPDIVCGDDPTAALADAYRAGAIGPRTPVEALSRLVESSLDEVDAVVFSMPPDDTVFGWDYPRLREVLSARQLPHVCLRLDPCRPLTGDAHSALAGLTRAGARRRQEAGRG